MSDISQVFSDIYHTNFWRSEESVSGTGSTLEATSRLQYKLRDFFSREHTQSLLDIPCGDFNWGKLVDWPPTYIGADIVPEIIEQNRAKYPGRTFYVLDATKDELPEVEVIFCRDMLGHFSNRDVQLAIKNFRASGSKYLLSTTFPQVENSGDIVTGQWRPINLAQYFGLGQPIEIINEGLDGKFKDKSLGLWRLQV